MSEDTISIIALFAFLLGVVKVLADNWTRRKLIEARLSEDVIRALFASGSGPDLLAALKWGIVLAAVGVGVVISHFLPARFEEPLAWGLVLMLGGAGLLVYYAAARTVIRRDRAAGSMTPPRQGGFPDELP